MILMNDNINLDEKYEDLQEILFSSKEFNFKKDTILVIRQYYGKKEICLDLSKLDKEALSNIIVDKDKIYDEEYEI